jgi:hypothetical protein
MLRTLHAYLPFIDDRRGRRIGELLGILWVLSLADLGFTLWAQSFTRFVELNPLVAPLLHDGRFCTLILMKVGLTAFGATVFWRLRAHGRAEVALWGVVGCYVALAFRWSAYTLGATPIM